MATYQYDVDDTLNDKVNGIRLRSEIDDAAIAPTLESITIDFGTGTYGTIDITFNTDLSAGEQTVLDGVVAAHDGTPLIDIGEGEGEPNGFPNRTDSGIAFNDSSPDRTFTISPTATEFSFHSGGSRFTHNSAKSIQISDVEGIHFISFDHAGELQETTTFSSDLIFSYAFTAIIYWNATNKVHILLGDERHGIIMDSADHLHWHLTVGTVFRSGLALSGVEANQDGSQDSHATVGYGSGGIADEDIEFTISADAKPAQIPVFYKDGASGYWRKDVATNFPVKPSSGTRLAYNQFTGGAWQQTEVSDSSFVLTHLFAVPDAAQSVIAIQGQNEYGDLESARIGASDELNSLVLSGLPIVEFKPIATIIYQTDSAYGNSIKARIISPDTGGTYVDWRYTRASPSSSPAEHNNLSGIGVNDHHNQSHDHDGVDDSGTVEGSNIKSTGETGATKYLREDGDGSCSWQEVPQGVVGTLYSYASSDSASSQNANPYAYAEKVSLTTAVVPAGDYMIHWSAEVGTDDDDRPVEIRVQIDDTTTLAEALAYCDRKTIHDQGGYYPASGIYKATLTNASHDIDMDWQSREDGKTVWIRRARITIWRVS